MAVSVTEIRELLLPGLLQITGQYKNLPVCWESVFEPAIAAPHLCIPKLTIPQAFIAGAAAAIIKNPEVTRRFWTGWVN